jgi:hypothetical protein
MKNKLSLFLLCMVFTLCATFAGYSVFAAPVKPLQPVNLGSAAPFAVLSATGVTNADSNSDKTVITGDLGVYPTAGTSIKGFSRENAASNCCGVVIGTIDDTGPGEPGRETTAAHLAQGSLTNAINDAKGRTGPCPCTSVNGENLGGRTLTPGLYTSATTISISGPLYLRGKGVYIFQIGTGLTVHVGAEVILEGGAQAAHVFWQVGSAATLASGVKFEGNILAGTSVTMGEGTVLVGRALASTGNVTLISDTVTLPPAIN